MNDYGTLLERVADRADPTLLPDPATLRRASDRRRRKTIGIVAAASVAVLAVGASLAFDSDSSSPRPTGPVGPTVPIQTPSSDEKSADAGVVAREPEPVTVAPGVDYFGPRSVVYFDSQGGGGRDVYVVVGDTSATFSGNQPTPPIWWSTDARTWHQATTGPEFPNVWDITTYFNGMAAIGSADGSTYSAWYSADGERWFQTSTPDNFRPFSLTATDAGLFAWDENKVYAAQSEVFDRAGDGWGEIAIPAGPGEVCFVKAHGGDTVLGAMVNGEPAAWTLQGDGSWQQTTPTDTPGTAWCGQQEQAHWTARGPAGTVTVRPYEDPLNTVFVEENGPRH